jgi:hypothetical protein
MLSSAIKPAGAFAIGGVLLPSSWLRRDRQGHSGPCGRISHELASLEKEGEGHNLYSAEHAQAFRDAAGQIRLAGLEINREGQSKANKIATGLEGMATGSKDSPLEGGPSTPSAGTRRKTSLLNSGNPGVSDDQWGMWDDVRAVGHEGQGATNRPRCCGGSVRR